MLIAIIRSELNEIRNNLKHTVDIINQRINY